MASYKVNIYFIHIWCWGSNSESHIKEATSRPQHLDRILALDNIEPKGYHLGSIFESANYNEKLNSLDRNQLFISYILGNHGSLSPPRSWLKSLKCRPDLLTTFTVWVVQIIRRTLDGDKRGHSVGRVWALQAEAMPSTALYTDYNSTLTELPFGDTGSTEECDHQNIESMCRCT